ncbi:MAG TPA: hypothetical protein VIR58_00995 [Acidimicrobiales bacterium]
MTVTEEPVTTTAPPPGPSPEEREARLVDGADDLATKRGSLLAHPQLLLAVAAALMTSGLCAIVLGWFGASHSTLVEEQVPYLISGGLLGVAMATVGAVTLFAHWLTVMIREARAREASRKNDHIELMEALAQLTAAMDGKVGTNGTARGARSQRPLRRAPRGT